MSMSMYLVYTNSMEKAITLASMLGGVSVGNTIADYSNLDKYHDTLRRMLESDGFLISVFNATPHVIVYSDGTPAELYRMVDYNPDYRDIKARPVPFPANENEGLYYRCVDAEFEKRLDIYFGFIKRGVNKIINATPDNIQGEQAFAGFRHLLNQKCIDEEFVRLNKKGEVDRSLNRYFRARPRSWNLKDVSDAFTAMDIGRERKRTLDAATLANRINWLIAANGSNLLYQKTGKTFLVGRLECAYLHMISNAYRDKIKGKQHYRIVADMSACIPSTGEVLQFTNVAYLQGEFPSEKDANEALKDIPNELTCIHSEFIRDDTANLRLYTMFTLQIEAAEKLHADLRDAQTAIYNLYDKGYITWPSESNALPWRLRGECKRTVEVLSSLSEYSTRIAQHDIDTYTAWDKESEEEAELNHSGIMIARRYDAGIPMNELEFGIYQLIAERFIQVIAQQAVEATLSMIASDGERVFVCEDVFYYDARNCSKADALHRDKCFQISTVSCGDTILISNPRVERLPDSEAYTELSLVKDLLPHAYGTYCNDIAFFTTPIDTLYSWKLIEKDENGFLRPTKKGKKENFYIDGLSMADIDEAYNWDRRVQQAIKPPLIVTQDDGSKAEEPDKYGVRFVTKDVFVYLADLTEDLTEKYKSLEGTENIDIDECVCPICGEQVVKDGDNGWRCSDEDCPFTIPSTHYGHSMTWEDVWQLLTRGYTERHDDFVKTNTNTTYSARIVFTKDHHLGVNFNYPLPCPVCGKDMQEWPWSIRCKDTSKCKFSMNTTICGVKLPNNYIETILKGGKTPLIKNFTNKNGKEFAAKLYLDGKKIGFDFPPKES